MRSRYKIKKGCLMLLFLILLLFNIQEDNTDIGLDLNEVVELASKSRDAAEFEAALNKYDASKQINNVDLDQDGFIDYISVSEKRSGTYKNGEVIYTLSVDDKSIATIRYIYPDEVKEQTKIIVLGNNAYYGNNAHYINRVHFGFHGFWSNRYWTRSIYLSPYRYRIGYKRSYPKYWKRNRVISRKIYRANVKKNNKRRNYKINKAKKVRSKKQKNVKTKMKVNKAKNKKRNRNKN